MHIVARIYIKITPPVIMANMGGYNIAIIVIVNIISKNVGIILNNENLKIFAND